MTDSITADRMRPIARLAGVLYLIIIICGIASEVGIRSGLIVAGDAAATATNIRSATGLFRMSLVLDSIMLMADVAIAVLLYWLLASAGQLLSLTAAAFRLIQASLIGVSLLVYFGAFLLLTGSAVPNGFESGQVESLALLFLDMHGHGYDLGLVFFAVSNVLLGVLVIRSALFPDILGYGLIAAAAVYLAGSSVRFLAPAYLSVVEPAYIVPLVAELAFGLWLLIKGVREGVRA